MPDKREKEKFLIQLLLIIFGVTENEFRQKGVLSLLLWRPRRDPRSYRSSGDGGHAASKAGWNNAAATSTDAGSVGGST